MEFVQQRLQEWGELIIHTDGDLSYEIHLGDTRFDAQARVINLTTPQGIFLIDGDSVVSITQHYGHPVD